MFTIWVQFMNGKTRIDVADLDAARTLWDMLASRFEMLSQRP